MGKHLVLVGGGHAHMTALVKLGDYVARGHRVTVISTSEYQYYSGMGPGMLSGRYRPQDIRFHLKPMVEERGGTFIEDTVVGVEPAAQLLALKSGLEISYDIVSFNTGSTVPLEPLVAKPDETIIPVKPIINLLRAQSHILQRLQRRQEVRIVVVGAGSAGVEISANAHKFVTDAGGRANVTLVAGPKLLPNVPDRARKLVRASFAGRSIHTTEGVRASSLGEGAARLEDGRSVPYDIAFVATGVSPSPLFRDSGLPTAEDGGLLVNRYLQSPEYPAIFGGGDCISLEGADLARVGVYAVRQNPVLHNNLQAALEDGELREFDPGGVYLLILNMGDGRGVFWRKGLAFDGRAAFGLKNFLDQRFVRRFQVSGERKEGSCDAEQL